MTMIRVFNGKWRGLGEQGDSNVGMLLNFRFREILGHFKGARLAVFIEITLHSDENGIAYPSYDLLEKETGYARAAVAKALDELCKMEIEGMRVLARIRLRDENGHFAGSNRYLVFPTPEELQSFEIKLWSEPEFEKRTLGKANVGKSELEVKPEDKDKPSTKGKRGGRKSNADPRTSHPAIQAIKTVTGRYPSKDVYEPIIKTLGESPDIEKMRQCWEAWRLRDYKPTNYGWVTDWYVKGIPQRGTTTKPSEPAGYAGVRAWLEDDQESEVIDVET